MSVKILDVDRLAPYFDAKVGAMLKKRVVSELRRFVPVPKRVAQVLRVRCMNVSFPRAASPAHVGGKLIWTGGQITLSIDCGEFIDVPSYAFIVCLDDVEMETPLGDKAHILDLLCGGVTIYSANLTVFSAETNQGGKVHLLLHPIQGSEDSNVIDIVAKMVAMLAFVNPAYSKWGRWLQQFFIEVKAEVERYLVSWMDDEKRALLYEIVEAVEGTTSSSNSKRVEIKSISVNSPPSSWKINYLYFSPPVFSSEISLPVSSMVYVSTFHSTIPATGTLSFSFVLEFEGEPRKMKIRSIKISPLLELIAVSNRGDRVRIISCNKPKFVASNLPSPREVVESLNLRNFIREVECFVDNYHPQMR